MTDQAARVEVEVRLATVDDLLSINEIYNVYVPVSTCTYQEAPETFEDRKIWFETRGPAHPVTVAIHAGRIVGWGALSMFRSRSAYRHTVEISVYVEAGSHRRGIGTALLRDLCERAQRLGHHAIVALIDSEQTVSLRLHAKCGFHEVGRFRQVGFKLGRWLDAVVMERVLG